MNHHFREFTISGATGVMVFYITVPVEVGLEVELVCM